MTELTSQDRAQAQQVYTLTDELQVRLRMLEEWHGTLDIKVMPGRGMIVEREGVEIFAED
jgi:hypothetical protein